MSATSKYCSNTINNQSYWTTTTLSHDESKSILSHPFHSWNTTKNKQTRNCRTLFTPKHSNSLPMTFITTTIPIHWRNHIPNNFITQTSYTRIKQYQQTRQVAYSTRYDASKLYTIDYYARESMPFQMSTMPKSKTSKMWLSLISMLEMLQEKTRTLYSWMSN